MTPERLDAIRGAAETCQWGRDADAAEMLLDLLAALDEAHARLAHAEADAAQAIHYVSRERDAAVVELSTAYSETLLKLDTATRAKAAWEGLYNERSAQCTIAERKLEQIKSVLDDHGCAKPHRINGLRANHRADRRQPTICGHSLTECDTENGFLSAGVNRDDLRHGRGQEGMEQDSGQGSQLDS